MAAYANFPSGTSITVSTCESPSPPVSATGDSHLSLAYGGKADFRGTPGAVFNLLSAVGLSLSALFSGAMYKLREVVVNASS